jgi:hypothetical protein
VLSSWRVLDLQAVEKFSARGLGFGRAGEALRGTSKSAECASFPGVAALMFCIKARLLEAAEKLKAEGTGEGMYGLQR